MRQIILCFFKTPAISDKSVFFFWELVWQTQAGVKKNNSTQIYKLREAMCLDSVLVNTGSRREEGQHLNTKCTL